MSMMTDTNKVSRLYDTKRMANKSLVRTHITN